MTDSNFETSDIDGPHAGQPIVTSGASPDEASAAMVLVHGRGATAQSILDLADEFRREEVAFLAPQAARNTWYPQSFLAPLDANQPYLSSALSLLETLVSDLESVGIPPERVFLLGFSQGACLTTEFVARNAQKYGGVAAFSGGLIGPEGTPREYEGSLDGTPVYLGCGNRDPHIPVERVHETEAVLTELDGSVTERIFEGMAHGVVQEEIAHVDGMVDDLLSE
ncbi:phospholipase/Carboxylesterase [Haladaptatus paucihalophilus DX253]|uniref:Phospholipase/Carboxylesterase n=1 Tax=Haladaptatus paucihalophilus DX253 TaxID=797209 RepID=E7QXR6_HALPU|nr:dienelactone hydrolase family protein [Haladaptatus paucihalophilus]EFW90617.1 phospholipase/Carboxylesterase [Haladaptatus paucihalophilus DX253]SHL57122.1 phospholipase/carboxylesterase [Haladaptatus paucihalophilus DX253]